MNCVSSLNTSKMMEKEYATEIENLQKQYDKEKEAAVKQWKECEHNLLLASKSLSDKVEVLEENKRLTEEKHRTEMMDMQLKVKEFEEKLKSVPDTSISNTLEQIESQNLALKEKVEELIVECSTLKEQIGLSASKIEELTNDLIETKACLTTKKEDLVSCMDSLASARDENVMMRNELEMLKSNPQNNKKGNSLFAEVEDNRQSMKKNLDAAVNKYRQMKKQYTDKCAEASKFRSECVFLCQKWNQLEITTKQQENHLVEAHKSRIKELEERVQKLEGQKPPYIISSQADDSTKKFVEFYAESSRKECKKLADELYDKSVKLMFSSDTLYQTQKELEKRDAELMQARAQIMSLQECLGNKEKLEN